MLAACAPAGCRRMASRPLFCACPLLPDGTAAHAGTRWPIDRSWQSCFVRCVAKTRSRRVPHQKRSRSRRVVQRLAAGGPAQLQLWTIFLDNAHACVRQCCVRLVRSNGGADAQYGLAGGSGGEPGDGIGFGVAKPPQSEKCEPQQRPQSARSPPPSGGLSGDFAEHRPVPD